MEQGFKVGDKVIVLESAANEVYYAPEHLGVNTIIEIEHKPYKGNYTFRFEGHYFVCYTRHLAPLTKLHKALL